MFFATTLLPKRVKPLPDLPSSRHFRTVKIGTQKLYLFLLLNIFPSPISLVALPTSQPTVPLLTHARASKVWSGLCDEARKLTNAHGFRALAAKSSLMNR